MHVHINPKSTAATTLVQIYLTRDYQHYTSVDADLPYELMGLTRKTVTKTTLTKIGQRQFVKALYWFMSDHFTFFF